MDSSLEKLKDAFVQAIHVSPQDDFDSLAYGQTPGWDSVAHIKLVAAIEEAFEIMLATNDVIGMSSFAKAKEIVSKNGVVFA